MTLRAKTGGGRPRRSSADNEARQKLLVTLGFIGVILTAVGILGAAVAASYYNDHLKAIATVDGVGITKDQLDKRAQIVLFTIDQGEKRVRESLAAGEVGQDLATQQLQQLSQQRDSLAQDALNDLVNEALVVEFAAKDGTGYSDADLEAALTKQASKPEKRKILAIFVVPEATAGAEGPTPLQRGVALVKADQALAAVNAGTDWAVVAKQYSNDISKEQGGDFGEIESTNGTDRAWVNALFALPSGGTTDVIEGADGTFRIGRVAQITPAVEDPAFRNAVEKGPGIDDYKLSLVGPVLQRKMTDKLVAKWTSGPVEQVHASEILIASSSSTTPTGDEIRASHILFAPAHDPGGASALPSDDPGWNAAKALADAEVAKLKAITDVTAREAAFAADALTASDDKSSGAQGGDLGWFARGAMVQEFSDALFEGTHTKGEIVGPIKSQFGWHVILFEGRRPPAAQRVDALLTSLAAPGADFAAVAKAESTGLEASKGGDLGWIIRGESRDIKIEDALFALQPGQVSKLAVELSDGFHIYKVIERATKPATGTQINQVYIYAFSLWFEPLKAKATITYASGAAAVSSP
jgi:parvulin-like peptidyl-prolyl isomerase